MGYLGISSIKAANNILAQDISFASLVKQSSLKQTDGVTNILLLGKGGSNHPGGQLTDTIMLARLKQDDKRMALISVPRDLLVNVPGKGQVKINEAYTQGFTTEKDNNKKSDAGAKTASSVIEKTLGVPVHYYIVVFSYLLSLFSIFVTLNPFAFNVSASLPAKPTLAVPL